jgi:hypothetical protein
MKRKAMTKNTNYEIAHDIVKSTKGAKAEGSFELGDITYSIKMSKVNNNVMLLISSENGILDIEKYSSVIKALPKEKDLFKVEYGEIEIECSIESRENDKTVIGHFTPIELLKNTEEDIIEILNHNFCSCEVKNETEDCFCKDCNCQKSLKEFDLFVDGVLVK